jgi:acetate kinase
MGTPTDAILVLNAGSSSIKFSLFAEARAELALVASGQVEGIYTAPHFVAKDAAGTPAGEKQWDAGAKLGHEGALEHIIDWLKTTHGNDHRLAAVGHRVVHGGTEYAAPVRLDAEVVAKLEKFVPLAPLHQPHNLAPIRALLQRAPELPQVACFDTAMHRSNPPLAQMFALPQELTDAGVRRYGFHGLSYEYIASVLTKFDGRAARGKTVVLHLGNGASMCALDAGRSVASTMGFTAVDGLPMGTRTGQLDPGVVLYLLQAKGFDAARIQRFLYHDGGLKGLSGVSNDVRDLLASAEPGAVLALDYFVYRIVREAGALAATMEGIDGIVFTAGVGEHSPDIRRRVIERLGWLGVELDPGANARHGPLISTAASRLKAYVVPTDEERMIARHTLALLGATW